MNRVTTFLSEVQTELKKVTWPTREQTLKLTAVVIGVSLIVGTYVSFLDFILSRLIRLLIWKN